MIASFSGEYRFLSNFWWFNGTTVEHHFQAAKTDDSSWVERILGAASPAEAKALGRVAPMRPSWPGERLLVMRGLLLVKFTVPDLREQLVVTGDEELVEGNTWRDTFWGVCQGKGENHLGKLLMWVREVVR